MKLAFICTEKLPVPPVAGGAVQLYIDGIIPYLSREHDITVFSIEHPGLPSEETSGNVRHIRVPAGNTARYVNNIKPRLTEGFDLVHVFNRPTWIAQLSRELPETKFSLSLHNEMFHPEKISSIQAKECIERVEFINTVSQFIADGVKTLYPFAENKLNVVYSGADSSKFKTAWSEEGIKNKLRLTEKYHLQGYKIILFVGRLSNKKGVHVLLKAMRQVMEYHRNVALVIVGSKWYGKNEVDDYTKSLQLLTVNLPGPVVFTGFLTPDEIPAHFNLGDIFVCASQWNEPLARVHYEAMAAGLPIITTHRGGNAEIIDSGENGFSIDEFDNPNAFVDEIDFLLENPKIASDMGHKGRKMAEEKFTWERVARDVLKPLKNRALQMHNSYNTDCTQNSVREEEIIERKKELDTSPSIVPNQIPLNKSTPNSYETSFFPVDF